MPLFGPPNVRRLKAKGNVKELIKALGYQKDKDVREAAAGALGEIGDIRAVEPLIAALPNQAAAWALGEIGDIRAVEPLITTLPDQAAVDALAKIGAPAVEPLIAALPNQAATWALGEIGDIRAVEPLITTLPDQDSVDALAKIGTPAVEPLIATLMDMDRDKDMRQAAIRVLDKLGWQPDRSEAGAAYWIAKQQWDRCVEIGTPAVEPLIATLMDRDKDVRAAAAKALERIGDTRAVDPLTATLMDRDKDMRQVAIRVLDKLGWQPDRSEAGAAYWIAKQQWDRCVEIGAPAVEPLIAASESMGYSVKMAALNALAKIGTPAVEPLIAALPNQAATWALGKIGDIRAVEPLITTLPDKAAIDALAKIGTPAVEPLIATLMDMDRDKDVRAAAAKALERIRDIRAVEPLTATLMDRDKDMRQAAVRALDKLGWQPGRSEAAAVYWIAKQQWDRCVEIGAPAVEPLIAALPSQAATQALGKIGDIRAVEPLTATLMDRDKDMRRAAIRALDKLGWQPDRSEAAAVYWIAKQQWDRCVEIGTPAVEPLIAAINRTTGRTGRLHAAEALVKLYRGGELDERSRQRILAMQETMTRPHRDHNRPNDCHDDVGIGVTF